MDSNHPTSNKSSLELESEAALMHAVNEAASSLQEYEQSQELSLLLEKIVEQAVTLISGSGGGFYFANPETRVVQCAVSYQTPNDYRGITLDFGEGVAGIVAESRKPLIIDDYRLWPGRANVFENEQPFRAVISVPVIWQNQVTGVLHVLDQNENRRFSQKDLDLLTFFASHAAIAIENARLLESERRRSQEAETLRNASTALTSTLDLTAVLANILTNLEEIITFDSATVFLSEGNVLIAQATIGLPNPEEIMGHAFPADNPLIEEIHRTGIPLILEDAQIEPSFMKWGETDNVHSWMGIPMIVQNKVTGYVTCDSRQTGIYSQHDATLAQALANQAAIAIENARLFSQSQTERSHLGLLYDISRELAGSLDVNEILSRAVSLTSEALNGLVGEAFLYLPEDNRLSLRAIYGRRIESLDQMDKKLNLHLGQGLAGWVAERQSPICIPDVNLNPDWLYIPGLDEDVQSVISSPILSGNKLIGVLSVLHQQTAAFSEEHLELLQAICQEVGFALSNANQYEETKRRLAEITLIQNLAQIFSQRLEVQVLLDEVAIQLGNKLGYPYVLIYLIEEDKLVLKATNDCYPEEKQIPLSMGITGRAARSGQGVLVTNVSEDPNYYPCSIHSVAELVVPIMLHRIVVGVICILSEKTDQLSTQDLDFLEVLAGQISIALENAFLYEKVRLHATELEQTVSKRTVELTELYQLSQEIGYPLSYRTLIQLVLQHLQKAMGCDLVIGCLDVDDRRVYMIESNQPISSKSLREIHQICFSADENLGEKMAPQKYARFEVLRSDDYDNNLPEIQQINSLLQVPILVNNKPVGLLIAGCEQHNAFGFDQERVLTTFANQASSVVTHLSTIFSEQKRQLESLVQYLPVGVLLLSREFRILAANPLGRELISVINNNGDTSSQFLLKVGVNDIQELIPSKVLHNQEMTASPIEIEIEGPPRRFFHAQVQQAGIDPDSHGHQWILMINEVTEERENMIRIQSQERLATVGQLAAGIAHDFNNIMATILIYTDLMRYDTSMPLSSQEKLNVIHEQIQRASSLIRQILDFSRKSLMENIKMDLLPFIKELDSMLARVLPETIQLELAYQPDEYWINGDPTRLQQVFMNLALNARDAMPQGGNLSFKLSIIEIGSNEKPPISDLTQGRWINIKVADTGIGISHELRDHLFEPFYTTKPAGQGIGLGLAQVYGIVKQHGGHIYVESQTVKGTTFSLYFPALELEEKVLQEPEVPTDFKGKGQTILMVEDDQKILEAMRALLIMQGYNVLAASNGIEAIKWFDDYASSVALVISDIVMPEMGGFDLYQALISRDPKIKMLFLTGHPMEDETRYFLEKGNVQWMQKPFSVVELNKIVTDILMK